MNLHMRKTEKSSWKKWLEKHNEILIRIQFILEVSVYRRRLWNKNFKLYGPVLWTKLACFKIMCCFWAVDYFHCYLNQMPKQLIHSSYILKTKKDWKYWLNYSEYPIPYKLNSLRNLTYWVTSHFLNTAFYKLVYTYF